MDRIPYWFDWLVYWKSQTAINPDAHELTITVLNVQTWFASLEVAWILKLFCSVAGKLLGPAATTRHAQNSSCTQSSLEVEFTRSFSLATLRFTNDSLFVQRWYFGEQWECHRFKSCCGWNRELSNRKNEVNYRRLMGLCSLQVFL